MMFFILVQKTHAFLNIFLFEEVNLRKFALCNYKTFDFCAKYEI